MQPSSRQARLVALAFTLAIGVFFARAKMVRAGSDTRTPTIGCRVIESKTAPKLGVTLVVFHQAESADRDSLGAFLRSHDGATVEFQTEGGTWQPASAFRLKSCFGRGLLALPATAARLDEGDRFLLRSSARHEP